MDNLMLRDRPQYLEKLRKLRGSPFIKVITGVRRCGKSTLLDLYERRLLSEHVGKENIVRINLDSREHRTTVKDADGLYDLVKGKLGPGKNYVMIDEIQNINDWEGALISMFTDMKDVDLYVTGSNSVIPDIGVKLVGRFVEIHVLPLSFREFLEFKGIDAAVGRDMQTEFEEYLRFGGFPAVVLTEHPELKTTIADGIYRTILNLDVGVKHDVKDRALLRSLAEYLIDNAGNIVSAKSISDYLSANGRRNSHTTVDNYIGMMTDAFLLYKAKRYDVNGKAVLKTLDKYYVVDPGIRTLVMSTWSDDYGRILENAVCMELIRRGYGVSVGRVGKAEVDFVATKNRERIYYQVTQSLSDGRTKEREIGALLSIRDGYGKVVLSMDRTTIDDYSGVKNVNIIDWLLE
ncbi:MAG: ATP-binding protein [Candidatus Methanoplasma sp.]|jgi:predicted AAA+ superfamily ATPase|nr:ATP-binding protein [Candidatus Methanoplasma sp.]